MAVSASVSDVHRPAISLFARIAMIPFVAALIVLLLSDRAPGLARSGLRKGLAAGRKVEGRTGIDVVDHTDVPFSWEQLGHAGLWAMATLLLCAVFVHRASILQVASGVFALSASFELGQFAFTSTRRLEWADLVSNGVGVILGIVVTMTVVRISDRRRLTGVAARSITG